MFGRDDMADRPVASEDDFAQRSGQVAHAQLAAVAFQKVGELHRIEVIGEVERSGKIALIRPLGRAIGAGNRRLEGDGLGKR